MGQEPTMLVSERGAEHAAATKPEAPRALGPSPTATSAADLTPTAARAAEQAKTSKVVFSASAGAQL
jgi:hypothetical protein